MFTFDRKGRSPAAPHPTVQPTAKLATRAPPRNALLARPFGSGAPSETVCSPEDAARAAWSDGEPLPAATRSYFEPHFGKDLSQVRVHADAEAATAARVMGARAFTIGPHIVFGAHEYAPGTGDAERLLAHELAHVVQQGDSRFSSSPIRLSEPSDPAEREAHALADSALRGQPASRTGPRAGEMMVMRQPSGQPAVQTGGPPPNLVQDAIHYLREMAQFIAFLRIPGRPPTTSLDQTRVARYILQARSTYEAQLATLPQNDPQRVDLRAAYVAVLEEIRRGADLALAVAETRGGAGLAAERTRYAENSAAWIEASPMTSAGLSDTATFGGPDARQAAGYETSIEAYLDGLLLRLPGLALTQQQKDDIFQRLQVALRRAFVTISADAAGTLDLRSIDNPRIVDKYQRLVAMLERGISSHTQMSLITDTLALATPPNPVPNVTAQLAHPTRLGPIDLRRVPAAEVDSVRFALVQVDSVILSPKSTVTLTNAYWPLSVPIRSGNSVTRVRYELVFDASSNVRVERLGPDRATAVPPAFSALSVPDKIASLVADFQLADIVRRPALPGTAPPHAAPPRPAANWTGPELDQIRTVFDRLPAPDRAALRGVTLVRDHTGPPSVTGAPLAGFAHTGADPAHDAPSPPSHGPPHIHYYDFAFSQNATNAVGPPGATGPGGDFTIAHEVGHMRIDQAFLSANAAIQAANTNGTAAVNALNALVSTTPMPAAQITAWNAWSAATAAAGTAILNFNQSAIAGPPGPASQQALTAAQTAITTRNTARAALATAGVPANLIAAAARLDAARDALLAASRLSSEAHDQIPIFVALAARFGFSAFTDYAKRGGNKEFFAETFALYVTDPNRLNQMNRNIFLWFRAGMPQNRAWVPPP